MRPPIVLIKVGTVGDFGHARVNHIACKIWDPDSVNHLYDRDAAGNRVVPDCFLPGDDNSFECIMKPDDKALAQTRSEHNRGVTIKQMQAAKPFEDHVEALMAFLKGKQLAAFNEVHVRKALNNELSRLKMPELSKDDFIRISPRLTDAFKYVDKSARPADRKLNTYARHFEVAHPYHAVKRCNAEVDVAVLAKVFSHLAAMEAKQVKPVRAVAAMAAVGVMASPKATLKHGATKTAEEESKAVAAVSYHHG